MQTGKVKWFSDEKGFGFVSSQNKDYFIHHKEIQAEGFRTLKEGQTVSFVASQSPKGLIATCLRVQSLE